MRKASEEKLEQEVHTPMQPVAVMSSRQQMLGGQASDSLTTPELLHDRIPRN